MWRLQKTVLNSSPIKDQEGKSDVEDDGGGKPPGLDEVISKAGDSVVKRRGGGV